MFNLAKTIKVLREASGLTQVRLSKLAGLNANAACNLDNNNHNPGFSKVQAVLKTIGYDLKVVPIKEKKDENTRRTLGIDFNVIRTNRQPPYPY